LRARGGWLTIEWDGQALRMTGPTTTVFSSSIDIDRLVASIPTGI
jgi:diaminopimelate epimerase